MKKVLAAVLLLGFAGNVKAGVWDEWRRQVIGETKLTIHKDGGIAGFYDASVGGDYTLKEGILSHVLTNRFIAGSLGWYSADNQEGVLVGGPSIKIDQVITALFPGISNTATAIIPVLRPLDAGFNWGFGTDNGRQHYGFHIMWNFGK